jgi:hypothetical protein
MEFQPVTHTYGANQTVTSSRASTDEYCAWCREVLSVNNGPLPLFTSPLQTAGALRSISRTFQADQALDGI